MTGELTNQINGLQQKIWRIERIICGPGEERNRLLQELSTLKEKKRELVAQRDAAIRQRNADSIALEFGTPGPISNDNRTTEERLKDIERKNQRQRERFAKEMEAMSGLLKPFTYTLKQ